MEKSAGSWSLPTHKHFLSRSWQGYTGCFTTYLLSATRPLAHGGSKMGLHTAHQIGALQFQLQKILFITSQKCRDGQQTLISCTSFQILHLQLAVLFQTKSPMSTFSVSGDRILSHIMPRSADDDTVCNKVKALKLSKKREWFWDWS